MPENRTAEGTRKQRDFWDKCQICGGWAVPVVLALVAAIGKQTYERAQTAHNKAQLTVAKVDTLEKYLPHLEKGGASRRAAIYAIDELGFWELAISVAVGYGGEESAQVLCELGTTNTSEEIRRRYFKAYQQVIERSPELALIGPPDEIQSETMAVPKTAFEEREKTVKVQRFVPEEKTKTVTVQKTRSETRTRTVTEKDPATGEPILDSEGNPITVEEEYEVEVPYTEEREETYTVMVPSYEDKTVTYTVAVPYTVEENIRVGLYDNNVEKYSEIIRALLQKNDYFTRASLSEQIASDYSIPSQNLAALEQRIAWHTVRDAKSGKLKYVNLPFPLEVPSIVRLPLNDTGESEESTGFLDSPSEEQSPLGNVEYEGAPPLPPED